MSTPWVTPKLLDRAFSYVLTASTGKHGGSADWAVNELLNEFSKDGFQRLRSVFLDIPAGNNDVMKVLREGGSPTKEQWAMAEMYDREERGLGGYYHTSHVLVNGVYIQRRYVGTGGRGYPGAKAGTATVDNVGIASRDKEHHEKAKLYSRRIADPRPKGDDGSYDRYHSRQFLETDKDSSIHLDRLIPFTVPYTFLASLRGMGDINPLPSASQELRDQAFGRLVEWVLGVLMGHVETNTSPWDLGYASLIPVANSRFSKSNAAPFGSTSSAFFDDYPEEDRKEYTHFLARLLDEVKQTPPIEPVLPIPISSLQSLAAPGYYLPPCIPPTPIKITWEFIQSMTGLTDRERIERGWEGVKIGDEFVYDAEEGSVALDDLRRLLGTGKIMEVNNGKIAFKIGSTTIPHPLHPGLNSLPLPLPSRPLRALVKLRTSHLSSKGKFLPSQATLSILIPQHYSGNLTLSACIEWDRKTSSGLEKRFREILGALNTALPAARREGLGELVGLKGRDWRGVKEVSDVAEMDSEAREVTVATVLGVDELLIEIPGPVPAHRHSLLLTRLTSSLTPIALHLTPSHYISPSALITSSLAILPTISQSHWVTLNRTAFFLTILSPEDQGVEAPEDFSVPAAWVEGLREVQKAVEEMCDAHVVGKVAYAGGMDGFALEGEVVDLGRAGMRIWNQQGEIKELLPIVIRVSYNRPPRPLHPLMERYRLEYPPSNALYQFLVPYINDATFKDALEAARGSESDRMVRELIGMVNTAAGDGRWSSLAELDEK